jgi:hypothetical protein
MLHQESSQGSKTIPDDKDSFRLETCLNFVVRRWEVAIKQRNYFIAERR